MSSPSNGVAASSHTPDGVRTSGNDGGPAPATEGVGSAAAPAPRAEASAETVAPHPKRVRSEASQGLLFGIGAYGLWGVMPVYFVLLEPAGSVEIVANRVVWSLIFCALLITFTRSWRGVLSVVRTGRVVATLSVAAVLIGTNWLVYVYGVTSGNAIETSLGYFINPLVSVLLGVLVLKEKLRRLQWAAVGIGAVAVIVLTVAYGNPPFIAFALALSFGFYGLVKKRVGSRVSAVSSLSVETAVLAPVAGGVMIWLAVAGNSTLTTEGPAHFWLMVSSGVFTAVPLLLFAATARRLPLATIGLLQYLTPTIQFTIAITVLGEHMPTEQWFGFGLVWIALIVLTIDMLRTFRGSRKLRAAAAAA